MSWKPYNDPLLDKLRTQQIVSGGTSTEPTPVGGDGITIAGGTYTAHVADVDGGRLVLSGGTAMFNPVSDIVTVSGSAVTLNPDTAYKIQATTQAVTLNANVPASGKWGLDGHAEIFVAGTGYVVTGSNVVLANALEPDAVNNCTVRFHDGIAIISVEDHVAGYIVVNGSTSGEGSLAYGIATSTNEYIAFDASLNGTTIDLSGSTASGEKHIVGNGYDATTITGSVDCGTSKFTVANLSLQDVVVGGGTMTLGDAYIPSGSTVAVSGGGLAIEKVTGNGGVIDLGGTLLFSPNIATTGAVTGVAIIGGSQNSGGGAIYAIYNAGSITRITISLTNCVLRDNNGVSGGAIYSGKNAACTITGCTFSGNVATYRGNAIYVTADTSLTIMGCTFEETQDIWIADGTTVSLAGSNATFAKVEGTGVLNIASGAILDLTGNTNATPIAPGGGITFAPGGATVLTGATAGVVDAQYSMDNVTLPAGAKLTNTAVVDLGGGRVTIGSSSFASGVTFSGASGTGVVTNGINISGGSVVSCTFTKNIGGGYDYGVMRVVGATLDNCVVSGNSSAGLGVHLMDNVTIKGGAYAQVLSMDKANSPSGAVAVTLEGDVAINTLHALFDLASRGGTVTISSGASINLTSSINPGGGITVLTGGCTVNGNVIPAGTYTSIDSNGQPT